MGLQAGLGGPGSALKIAWVVSIEKTRVGLCVNETEGIWLSMADLSDDT